MVWADGLPKNLGPHVGYDVPRQEPNGKTNFIQPAYERDPRPHFAAYYDGKWRTMLHAAKEHGATNHIIRHPPGNHNYPSSAFNNASGASE